MGGGETAAPAGAVGRDAVGRDAVGRDRAAAAIAAGQHGVVTYAQLLASGLTRRQVDQRVRSSQLQRLWRGVYAFGHKELTREGRLLAAVLACGEGAALSHWSAARHRELLRIELELIHVTAPSRSGRPKRRGIRLHCVRRLDPAEVTVHRGVPVTTVARTLVDLCAVAPPRQVERAFEQAHVLGLVAPGEIEAAVERAAGRTTRVLRALVDAERRTATLTRSELEERFLALVRRGGVPEPEVNARLHGYEVDFLWREKRRVIEVDGHAFHRTRQATTRDRRKDDDLEAAGYRVTRFTADQVLHDPADTLVRTQRALTSATPVTANQFGTVPEEAHEGSAQ
jgi:very-short-patch-repair endonuclease